MESTSALSEQRRAAIIVAALGKELALQVCSQLPVGQVLTLGEEIARLGRITGPQLNQVLADFVAEAREAPVLGGASYARELLDGTLGLAGSSASLHDSDPEGLAVFSGLNELEPAMVWRLLREERPQTVAVIISHLTPSKAGQLLSLFNEKQAAEIAYRAAHLGSPSPGAMQALAGALDLELRAGHVRSSNRPEVSVQFVVDLLAGMAPDQSKQVLEALTEVDKAFGENVAEGVFTFDDIGSLPDPSIQAILRSIENSLLVVALKGTTEEFRERIKANLSQRAREWLAEELEMLGPVPSNQVQDAQRQICQEARRLADTGEISLEIAKVEYVE
jgi:flagellar motor switch protein FliG